MFLIEKYSKISNDFSSKGYSICKVKNIFNLEKISKIVSSVIFSKNKPKEINQILDRFNNLHNEINERNLNKIRMKTIQKISGDLNIKRIFFSLIDDFIFELVGNELAMQKNLNLVVQMPNDKSSIIDLHADTWGGNSPFELVVWLPLVDCFKTKSMFILDKKKANKKNIEKILTDSKKISTEKLFKKIKNDITWLDVKFGEVLLFQPSLPHGGRVNLEKETRISINTRFKGLFTPYNDKKLGEYFEPIIIKPCSKAGFVNF